MIPNSLITIATRLPLNPTIKDLNTGQPRVWDLFGDGHLVWRHVLVLTRCRTRTGNAAEGAGCAEGAGGAEASKRGGPSEGHGAAEQAVRRLETHGETDGGRSAEECVSLGVVAGIF